MKLKIVKKRISNMAIVVIGDDIINRTLNITKQDEEWKKIEDIILKYDNDPTEENLELIKDTLDPIRIANRKKIEAEKIIQAEKMREISINNVEEKETVAKQITDLSEIFIHDTDNNVYLKGFDIPMPRILCQSIVEAGYNKESKYSLTSLINFWKQLLFNPDKHVRFGLFKWLELGDFSITEEGNIISYRDVQNKVGKRTELQDFAIEQYTKLKKQKKGVSSHYIHNSVTADKKFIIIYKEEKGSLGSVADIYDKISEESDVVYSPWHNGPFGQEIKLQQTVEMPREECDNDPNASCSRGLHQKAKRWNSSFGKHKLICLVSPYNVVAIPSYDHGKFRCCEYLPIAEVQDYEEDTLNSGSFDINYSSDSFDKIKKLLSENTLTELQEKNLISDELKTVDMKAIVKEMNIVVTKRLINV